MIQIDISTLRGVKYPPCWAVPPRRDSARRADGCFSENDLHECGISGLSMMEGGILKSGIVRPVILNRPEPEEFQMADARFSVFTIRFSRGAKTYMGNGCRHQRTGRSWSLRRNACGDARGDALRVVRSGAAGVSRRGGAPTAGAIFRRFFQEGAVPRRPVPHALHATRSTSGESFPTSTGGRAASNSETVTTGKSSGRTGADPSGPSRLITISSTSSFGPEFEMDTVRVLSGPAPKERSWPELGSTYSR